MTRLDKEVQRLAAKYKLEAPIDVERVAESEGAIIAREHFSGVQSGFALRDGSRWVIGVNTATSRRRQRFTVAHELGHLLLHDGRQLTVDHSVRVNWRDHKSSMATDREEIEANAFAAQLLMPGDLVRSATALLVSDGIRTRDAVISSLAEQFDVSTEAMGYRLVNLGIIAS